MADTKFVTCNLCEALCGLRVTVEGDRVTSIRANPDDVFTRGHICPKGHALREIEDDPDRLRAPMRRDGSGRFVPISWDEALDEAGERLRAIRAAHGADAIALYAGNPSVHTHRAALGVATLTMALGSKNRYDANSQDSAPRLFTSLQMYGDGLSVPVPDVDRTDLWLILGGNPVASNGSIMSLGDVRGRLQAIRARGGRIVVVDPRRTETAAIADAHHFIRPGADAAFLFALLHVLFAERLVDEKRARAIATGYDTLRDLAARFPPERVAARVGIAPDTIRAIAIEFGRARRAVLYARVGVCQNEFASTASWLVDAVNLVTGNLDREGGAMFAQPAVDLAALARLVVGNSYDRYRSRVRNLPELFGAFPSTTLADEIETPGEGQVRGFVVVAGNPVLSVPNGDRLARALDRLECMVAVDYYLNETTRHAHLVLPPLPMLHCSNYDVALLAFAVRNVARFSPPALPRPDGARDDWEILSELALRVRTPNLGPLRAALRRMSRDVPDRMIDWLLRAGRHGDKFIGRKGGLTLAKLRDTPNGVDLGPLQPCLAEKVFTPDGMVRLAPDPMVADVPRLERWLDAPAPELSLIGRRHLRSNNSWMHNAPSLVKGPARDQLLVHPDDAARLSIADGARVRVGGPAGAVAADVRISDEMMPGVVSLPHGFGHGPSKETMRVAGAIGGPNVNAVTDDAVVEPVIGQSILNGVPVTLQPIE